MRSSARTPQAPAPAGRFDQQDLERIYRDEAPRLARFFRRHLRGSDDVPDLVQESFVRLAGSDAGKACLCPAAYLQRIARNLLFDRSRRSDVKLAHLHVPVEEHHNLSVAPAQGHAIEVDDVMKAYRRAVLELAPKTREVFILHRVEGATYREIGLKIGISIPTVEYHIARALMHIERALDRE